MKPMNTGRMNLDHNLFTQIGLDSGALTMLGAVVHSFGEPGEYRGTVRKRGDTQAVFYVSVDKESPVAQVNIDLAELAAGTAPADGKADCCCKDQDQRFTVNPRGYALFRVSSGDGGFDVHVRKASEAEDTKIFDSRSLSDGALFAATLLRPGTYAAANVLGKGKAGVRVAYPRRGDKPYRPPAPVRVKVTEDGIYPDDIDLAPAQGLIFECDSPARIRIELEKPDDGPREGEQAP